MPIYTIQTPDGRKVRIEAPDEATAIRGAREATAAPSKPAPGSPEAMWLGFGVVSPEAPKKRSVPKPRRSMAGEVAGALASVNRGILVGEEIGAGLDTLGDAVTGKIQGPMIPGMMGRAVADTYKKRLAEREAFTDQYAAERPKVAALARGVGMAPTVFLPGGQITATGRLGQAAQMGISGAAQGAAYGLLDRGTLEERIKAGQIGAAVGGVTGAALGAATGRTVKPPKKVDPQVRLLAEEGVQMTPGQIKGGIAKSLEDKLTSMPILGDEIIRARRVGLETFTRAPISRGLREIGEDLPEGLTGNEAIAYAQSRFSEGYQSVVPEIGVQLDDQFAKTIGDSLSDITSTMTPQARERLTEIMSQRLASRAQGGVLAGDVFKRVDEGLRFEVDRFASSQDPDARSIAEALKAVRGALKDAAQRQNPEFAQRLAALDRGYAQLVRAEGAAARTSAEGGVFSPAQYDQAVRAADNSVRYRQYAAGQAFGQDLADAGRAVLPSKVPDSGTAGRGVVGLALGGGGYAAGGPVGVASMGLGLKAASAAYSPRAIELANKALSDRIAREEAEAALNELRQMAATNAELRALVQEIEARLARGVGSAAASGANPPPQPPRLQ